MPGDAPGGAVALVQLHRELRALHQQLPKDALEQAAVEGDAGQAAVWIVANGMGQCCAFDARPAWMDWSVPGLPSFFRTALVL